MTTTTDTIRWYDEAAQLKIEQMDDLDHVDVVFAGTSMAWQAFVPAVFDEGSETTSYNAGLNGGTPEVMERWLLEEVIPRTNPTTVVWGLSSLDLAPDYGPQQREVYDEALASRTGSLADIEQHASRWSSLVANRTVLRSLNNLYGNGADQRETALTEADQRLGDNGERLDFRVNRSERQRQIMAARLRDFTPDPQDVATISRTVQQLQANGIEVILVQLPVPSRFISAHPGGRADYDKTSAAIASLARLLDTRLLRLTNGFQDADFVDLTHLDADAAEQLTNTLREAMTSPRDDRNLTVSTTTRSETAPQSSDCTTETIIDDYGFEIEISNCPESLLDEPPPAAADATPAATTVAAIHDTAMRRDLQCADGVAPIDALHTLADDVAALEQGLVALENAEAVAIYESIESIVFNSSACASSAVDHEPSIAAATAAVSEAMDSLYAAARNDRRLSNTWRHEDYRQGAVFLRSALNEGRTIDTIVVGNSIPKSAVDPDLLGDLTGTTVANVSAVGASTETLEWWVDEVLTATDAKTIIWSVTYFDLYALCGVERRGGDADARSARRQANFAGLVAPAARTTWDHFLGPLDVAEASADRSLGLAEIPGEFNEDAAATSLEKAQTLNLWQVGEPCVDRINRFASYIQTLRDDGRRVIVVSLPPFDGHADKLPGGFSGYIEDVEEFIIAAGAGDDRIFIGDRLEQAAYSDGVHFSIDGREVITRMIAEALEQLTPPG